MPRESKSGRERRLKYHKINSEFLVEHYGKPCPVSKFVTGAFRAIDQTHHIRGRAGDLLFDARYFLGVSQFGQDWIHAHPMEARKRGWLAVNACIAEAMEVFMTMP